MASQRFTEDLMHLMQDVAGGARERLTDLQRRLHGLPREMKMKIGAGVACVAVLAGALALRGEARPMAHQPSARAEALADADAPRAGHVAVKSLAAGSTQASHGDYKAAAQSYALAARKGDRRGLNKLVAMTRSPKCEERSEAADALASFHSSKAIAALKKLAGSKFKDEAKSPGIFSCSSRRAAQKALESQRHG